MHGISILPSFHHAFFRLRSYYYTFFLQKKTCAKRKFSRDSKTKGICIWICNLFAWLSVQNVVGKLKDMKKDGSVAPTVGHAYSLTALSATSSLSKNGVTAHTVATQRRKRKQLRKIKFSNNIEWQIVFWHILSFPVRR
jgi:hypothetical protein